MLGIRHRAGVLLILGLLFAALPASAWDFELIEDTDDSLAAVGSMPRDFHRFSSEVFFTATRSDTGMELFAVGAVPGTARLVADLAPAGASSYARVLGHLGGRLLVAAAPDNTDGDFYAHAQQIMRVSPDGAERQVLTAEPSWFGGFDLQRFEPIAQASRTVWFLDTGDDSLWASDGTTGGTGRIFARASASPALNCVANGRLVFIDQLARRVYASDGTAAGTIVVADFSAGATPYSLVAHAGACHFLQSSAPAMLWRSDGTAAGTLNVTALPSVNRLFVAGGSLIGVGSAAGTVELRRVGDTDAYWQGTGLALGDQHATVADHLVLSVFDTQVGRYRLLATDATTAGTRLVQHGGAALAVNYDARWSAGGTFLLLRDSLTTSYRVDPATAAATIVATPQDLFYAGAVELDGVLIGNAVSAEFGEEVWRSDGSGPGTYVVADIARETVGGLEYGRDMDIGRDNVLFYAAGGPRSGLWRSNGSATGTYALPRSEYDYRDVVVVQAVGGGVLFATTDLPSLSTRQWYWSSGDFSKTMRVWDQGGTQELLASDLAGFFSCRGAGKWNACGLPAGAAEALPLLPGADEPVWLVGSLGTTVLLWSQGQLWRSDGTPAGTAAIASPVFRPSERSERDSVRVGDQLYFEACTAISQQSCGLFASDGTPAGTRQIRQIYWPLRQMAALDGFVYFMTDNPSHQLWRSDGSFAGTQVVIALDRPLLRLATAGHRLHMLRDDLFTWPSPTYLVSDGTMAGTIAIAPPSGLSLRNGPLVAVTGNEVFLSCDRPSTGTELCRANADGGGLAFVADLFPGPLTSGAVWLGGREGVGYLAVNDGIHGAEPWRAIADRLFADGF